MIVALLGPNGQLGTDIRAANEAGGNALTITPVPRAALDVEDLEQATRFLRDLPFDAVINCTSYHKTDDVERNAQRAFAINAHFVQRLAAICAERRARLVHISTDYVFGGGDERRPLTETDPKAPLNVYGASKGMGEDLAMLENPDIHILRVASLFGIAGASGKGGNFVETMVRFGREKGELKVVADQFMSPTATADIASMILAILQRGAPAGIYHVVNSGAASWFEFASRIIERAGVEARVLPIPSSDYQLPAKRPPYSVLSNAKLARTVGRMRSWQDALDAYLVSKGYRAASSMPMAASGR